MSFRLADYSFMGRHPINRMEQINNWPGLYAILCRRKNKHFLVDVGETDSLRSELEESDRREMWKDSGTGEAGESTVPRPGYIQ